MSSLGRTCIALNLARSLSAVVLLALACLPTVAGAATAVSRPSPLVFEPNQGQADAGVRFLARGRGYGLFLTPSETVLVLMAPDPAAPSPRRPRVGDSAAPPPAVVRMRLVGADAGSTIAGVDPLPGHSHYLIGGAARWRRDVPTYGRVRYTDIYPGVSLLFYGHERQLEYDFVVAPGADPGAVVLDFQGADSLRVDAAGDLVLATAAGELRLRRPLIYQEADGRRHSVEGGYVLDGARVRFRVAAWDASRPLVIDPVLGYSTYLGGTSNDMGLGIAVDATGAAYVTGSTISSDFPVGATPVQAIRAGVTDAFVTKLDPAGATRVYSTYLGGSGDEAGQAIAVDALGNAYITGSTTSNNFPIVGGFQTVTRGGSEAFVSKLSPDGSALVYSSYLGSNTDDFAFGIALDAADNAYVTGSTSSPGFPNNNLLPCLGVKRTGPDAFVVKVNADGASLGYCAFIGGAGNDIGASIAADALGGVWVGGSTTSSDLPVLSPFQSTFAGQMDGFVAHLDPTGVLLYLTYLGGNGADEVLGIAVDATGNAYVTGSTTSTNFPLKAPLQGFAGSTDAFVTEIGPSGNSLVFSTYLGGTGADVGNAIGLNSANSTIYVAGSTTSVDFPLKSPVQGRLSGPSDAFVTKLAAGGAGFVYSTYLGGSNNDAAFALAVDVDGVVFLTGQTNSPDFPVVLPLQGFGGLLDAFVAQLADSSIIQFSATAYQVNENAGHITVNVQRSGDTSGAATVHFATSDGSATAGTDYTAASGTLSFAPGQIVASFGVTILNDGLCDGNQTVNLTLSSPGGGSVLGPRQTAVLTIIETNPCVQFSAATYSVNEPQAGTASATITVTRTGSTGGLSTVNYATSNGTALAGTHYTATSGTLTFSPGQASRTFTVPILNDHAATGPLTLNLALSAPTGAALGSPIAAVLTIVDFEPTVAFSAATFSVNEPAAGTTNAVITVKRTGTSSVIFLVDYATSNGTAMAGTDYTAASGTLTFGSGVTSKTFTVPILNNPLPTGPLTVNLTLSNPRCPSGPGCASLGTPNPALLTIKDSSPSASFALAAISVSEPTTAVTNAVITVKRTGTSSTAFLVDFATGAGGTAVAGTNYTAVAGTLTFSAGVTSRTFAVPILTDHAVTGPLTVNLALSNNRCAPPSVLPSPSCASIGVGAAVLTINDIEPTVAFASAAFSVKEPGIATPANAVVTVKRTGTSSIPFLVDFATSDGTAVAPTNYTATSGTLTFAAGQTSKTFSVPILHDGVATGPITVNLALTNPRCPAPPPATACGAGLGATSAAVLTIADFEPTVSFQAAGFTVSESTPTAAIVVTRGGSASVPFTVSFATSNGTAVAGTDYTAVPLTPLTFAAGVTTQTVHVPIIPNTIVDGSRTVMLTLSAPTPTVRIVGTNPATLTITDNDVGGSLQFGQAVYTVRESVSPVTVTVTRTGGAASMVTVNYAVVNGTAVGGTNFTATSGTLTFAAGQSALTFPVPILDDGVPTGDLVASLVLSAPGGGGVLGARSTATLKILDNEPTLEFSAPTYQVNEGGSIQVTVVRSGPAGLPGTMTVAYATSDGTAVAGTDYRATAGTLTFGPGVATRTFSVPTIGNNTQQNPANRTLTATLSGVTGGTLGLQATATLTVADNDVVGNVFFSAGTYTARKNGGIAAITVRRDGTAAGATVHYATADGTAIAGTNYVAKSGTLTFTPGQTSSNFYVSIINDTLATGALDFTIALTALPPLRAGDANLSLGAPSTATVVIQDTNSAGIVQFTTNAFSASATSGCAAPPCSAVLTIDRTQGAASGVSADFATADGTAVAGTDYVPTTGTVVFGNNQRLATISIPLLATATPGTTFFVILSNPLGGATIGGYSAVPVTLR